MKTAAASGVEVTSLHVSTRSCGASRGAEDKTGVEFLYWRLFFIAGRSGDHFLRVLSN